jgi:hypothetical protein
MVCFNITYHVRIIETAVVGGQASVHDELFMGKPKDDQGEETSGRKRQQQEPCSYSILHSLAPNTVSSITFQLFKKL